MNKLSTIEKIERYLFKRGDNVVQLDEIELAILRRLEDGYSQKLDKPELSDANLRDYLMTTYGIEKSQAYKDITNIDILLSNVRTASRSWHQYTAIKWAMDLYAKALKEDDNDAVAKAINLFGKYTRLDKDEIERPPYEKIIAPDFEPVMDPALLGKKVIVDREAFIKRLRKKFDGDYLSAEDATIE